MERVIVLTEEELSKGVSSEQIQQARNVDIVEFIRRQGYEVVPKGKNAHCLKEHDSLVITNNRWRWNREGTGGSTIDFAMHYPRENYRSFVDGVKHVLDTMGMSSSYDRPMHSALPQASPTQALSSGASQLKKTPSGRIDFDDDSLDKEYLNVIDRYGKLDYLKINEHPLRDFLLTRTLPLTENGDIVNDQLTEKFMHRIEEYGRQTKEYMQSSGVAITFKEAPQVAKNFDDDSFDRLFLDVVDKNSKLNYEKIINHPERDFLLIRAIPLNESGDIVNDRLTEKFMQRIGISPENEKRTDEGLQLPDKNPNNSRVLAYLHKTRGIDTAILYEQIKEGKLYESAKGHNCVFVGSDMEGVPRYGFTRGTLTGKKYAQDCPGSNKDFGYVLPGRSDRVFVVEAPIDALSHATLTKMNNRDYKEDYRLSLGGVADKALTQFLKDNPNIKRVVFCLDNDEAGRNATVRIRNKLSTLFEDRQLKITTMIPRNKDFNEDLVEILDRQMQQTRGM